jgi:hypothetical protein
MKSLINFNKITVRKSSFSNAFNNHTYAEERFSLGISVSKDARAWQNCEILGLEILEDGFGIPLLFGISRNVLQTIVDCY